MDSGDANRNGLSAVPAPVSPPWTCSSTITLPTAITQSHLIMRCTERRASCDDAGIVPTARVARKDSGRSRSLSIDARA